MHYISMYSTHASLRIVVCCSVVQCDAVWCVVQQCVAVCCGVAVKRCHMCLSWCVAAWCSMQQCVCSVGLQ